MLAGAFVASAQSESTATLSRGSRTRPGQKTEEQGPAVSPRMQQHLTANEASRPEAAVKYKRVIYRELDLLKEPKNAALYFPEDLVDGQENLFRIMFRLLSQNKVPAYEFLDGREDFTDNNRVKMSDLLSRFSIMATPAKGYSEKNQVYDIAPVDVPTSEVLAYYIIEHWTFDNRTNTMRTDIEAICPVVVADESSDIAGKTPMFWMKMADIKPYLQQQYIFIDDDNNQANYTYDDFFTLGLYEGKIYKTRNLRNRTLAQIHSGDSDDLKRAQDSIQSRLDHYADNLWVPTREELQARREAEAAVADSLAAINGVKATSAKATTTSARSRRTSTKTTTKAKAPKQQKETKPTPTSAPSRSVRNRKR